MILAIRTSSNLLRFKYQRHPTHPFTCLIILLVTDNMQNLMSLIQTVLAHSTINFFFFCFIIVYQTCSFKNIYRVLKNVFAELRLEYRSCKSPNKRDPYIEKATTEHFVYNYAFHSLNKTGQINLSE